MKIKNLGTAYVPGVCNIGSDERRLRFNAGILSLVVTLAASVLLVIFDMQWQWRLLVFLPAMGAAIGLLQGAFRFCVKFGALGVFNFGHQLGDVTEITDPVNRKKDRHRVRVISGLSLLLAAVYTVFVVLFPIVRIG